MKKLVLVLTVALASLAAYADNGMPSAPAMNVPNPSAAANSAATSATNSANSAAQSAQTQTQGLTSKLNINTASEQDLASLPGIGPSKAKAIVAGRPYSKPADVMKVKGIKSGVYAKIKNLITT